MLTAIDTCHEQLLDASREIGGVIESSEWFSYQVAERIAATGNLQSITVADLVALLREERARTNSRRES